MKLSAAQFDLNLRHTFTISRGSSDQIPVAFVRVASEGFEGIGECSPSSFYGQSVDAVLKSVTELSPWLDSQSPKNFRLLLQRTSQRLGGDRATLCAIDLAVHDWVGKRLGIPLWKLIGGDDSGIPISSYTLGIDSIEKMKAKLDEFASWPIFKVKVGTDHDLEIMSALRAYAPNAVFRVDANCAWTAAETIEKSQELSKLGVEFIEQPLPPEKLEEMEEVFVKSAIPVIADENSVGPEDVVRLHRRFHGINIKLVKCGGILPALSMIDQARRMGMKVMIGCMIESSVCCTAAAHLGALVDYLDIDGPLLISNDPFEGVILSPDVTELPTRPGLGILPREGFSIF